MQKLLVANWKANGDLELVSKVLELVKTSNIIICPPSCLLGFFYNSNIVLGVQNISERENGAYTGEITAQIISNLKVKYAIIGHSERRIHFKEKEAVLKQKLALAIKHNLTPIFCIGEKLEEKKLGKTFSALRKQLKAIKEINCIIAYEPVWAIGSGLTPSVKEIDSALEFIYKETGNKNILYGGSVNKNNVKEIIDLPSVKGILLGGASINLNEFATIVDYFKRPLYTK